MIAVTVFGYYFASQFYSPLIVMSYAMFFGAGLGFVYLVLILQKKLGFKFVVHDHTLLLIQVAAMSYTVELSSFAWKVALFCLYVLLILISDCNVFLK